MRTREGNSPDWVQIGEAYCNKPVSIRALAKHHGVSDTAVRKAAKRHGWVKAAENVTPCEPDREPEPKRVRTRIDQATKDVATVAELTARGRRIIEALQEELEFLNQHADILSEIVESQFNGEKDDRIRFKLLKALDHETRTKSSTQLASALQKLQDAAPGKKEERQDNANRSSSAGLFAVPEAPKLTH